MSGALPITYHLTRRQGLAVALRFGLSSAVLSVPGAMALLIQSAPMWSGLVAPLAVGMSVTALSLPMTRRGGIVADGTGIRPSRRVSPHQMAAWHSITDVRAERRACRTVPVVYLESGHTWRLRVPYDGVLLGADPRFDEKLCAIRNMWDAYRLWRRNPGTVDDDYSTTSVDD